MSAVTVKKPYGCGDKGPPVPLSPEMSLSLQLFLCTARMLWRGCLLFSQTKYNFSLRI